MGLTVGPLRSALLRCAARADLVADELNALDGRLGDGDLGATLQKCARNLQACIPAAEGDLGAVMKAAAVACTKASGSSFGTLLAVAFMTAAKALHGRQELPWAELSPLLGTVLDALRSRGGASLGDKTVLDTLEAVRVAVAGDDAGQQHRQAVAAVEATLTEFRQRPNRIGRARMFAERSVGLDDPGMVAFRHLVVAAGG